MFQKIISFFMTILMFLLPSLNIPKSDVDKQSFKTNYTCVFVHGLGGWGEYDSTYKLVPYWGVLGGDLMKYLNARGFDCAAASVNPSTSAWDRACELYAQLTGTVVDYGAEHSARCNHERFGEDFSGRALIDAFDSEHKINLFGHSFGGATILMFLDLLADGSEAERAATPADELSPLFEGGKAGYVYSLTTLAAPMNGTTAVEVADVVRADPNATAQENTTVSMLTQLAFSPVGTRTGEDTAGYDMTIDNALKMLEDIETQSGVYYFSIPCVASEVKDGKTVMKKDIVEDIYEAAGVRMAEFTGYTKGGIYIDESWQANDGLVNEISAKAPFDAPQKDIDFENIEKGIWNIYPTYEGDHMALMGDLLHVQNVRMLYVDMLTLINSL